MIRSLLLGATPSVWHRDPGPWESRCALHRISDGSPADMVAKVSIGPGFKQHFFISYSWAGAGKELARRLEQNLRHDGYTVWVDVTRMSGNINDAMAEGINTSMVFIPIMDIHYGKSKTCKKELNYASDNGKAIVPIRLTNQLPEGEKFIIAGLLHLKLDSTLWRPSYIKLLKELEKILIDVETVPSPRVPLSDSNAAQVRDVSATKSNHPWGVIGSAVSNEPQVRSIKVGNTSLRGQVARAFGAAQQTNRALTKTPSDASVPRQGESELIRNLEQRGIDFIFRPAFIPVSDISCKARVVNLVSIVNLQHTFYNTTEETLTECVYLFTVPENVNASVCGFYAEVAGRVLKGVVKEKGEAQREYTNARDKGTVSALMGTDVKPGQFRVSIGNLPGGAAATMHITFIMEVSSSSEYIRIVFPTQRPSGLESTPAVVGTDTKLQVEVGVELLSGTIRALSSPSHRNVFLEMGKTVKLLPTQEALADASASAFGSTTVSCARATYCGRPSKDPLEICVAVDPGSKPAGVIELDEKQGTSVGMLALTMNPPPPDRYRTEVLVIIDCGLSMRGEPLQMAVQLALRALQSAFAGLVLCFGEKVDRSSLKSIQSPFPSAKRYLDRIDAVLQRCGSGDKRELLPAIHAVLGSRLGFVKDMQTVILVLSDGKFSNLANVAATIPKLIAGATNQHFTVCTLGVGDDVSRPAVELLAQVGNGVCDFVQNSDLETERAWDTLASVVSVPWTRVQVIWPFASQHTIGMMPTARLGCLALSSMQEKSTMGDCAATSAVVRLGTEAKVRIPLKPLSDTFAHTIAAQKRIRELESLRKDAGRHDRMYAKEIARLGIAYQLASSQTSFVAIWDGTDGSVTHIDCSFESPEPTSNSRTERTYRLSGASPTRSQSSSPNLQPLESDSHRLEPPRERSPHDKFRARSPGPPRSAKRQDSTSTGRKPTIDSISSGVSGTADPYGEWVAHVPVPLYEQTGAINVPVSEHCLEDAQYVHGEEFITMRYTPVTVGPNDFSSKYTLRSHRLRERDPKVAVVLTMYNEPDDLFCKSFIALAKNIAWCCSPDSKYNWGPDGWKDVVIVIVGDGREKINQRVLTALGVQGVYVEGLMKTTHDGKDVTMHMFEYTTQVFVDRDLTVRTAKDGLPPVQVIFMLKEKNAKKINSHRWFFNGVCKQLQPEVCMLVDVGTRPSKSSILELYRAFDRNPRIGGACGEIKVDLGYGWRHLLNPLVAAQNFEYKMSNILDKSFESVFGYISVLPGAFSAYRYIAIQNTPLDRYFKGESLHSGVVDITTSNMYLAEDRILCFELISKYKEAWLLKYVKSARADTDTPASLPELISQRRRWLNGSVFATFHAITWWTQIFRSNHSPARKALLVVQMIYNLINLIFSWFNIANFFLSFYFLFEVSGQLGDASSPFGSAQTVVGQLLIQLYVFVLITQFVASLGNRPQGSVILYYSSCGILAVIMTVMIFLGGWAIAQSFRSYQAFLDVSPGTNAGLGFFIFFFTDPTFRDVLVSLLATYGLYIISSLLHWDAWHCLTSIIQYLLLLPTYINVFQVFAFCNIHDISWGTKGDNLPSAAVAGAKQKQSQPATIGGPIVMKDSPGSSSDGPRMSLLDKDDLEALWHKHYHQLEFNRANPVEEEDKPVVDEKTRNEDYFKLYRTRLVLTWLVTNFSIMIVFTSQTIRDEIGASLTKVGPDGKLIPRVNPYLTFLFWSVVVLSACRFIGSMVYITTWWMEESADDKAWKWEQQRGQRDLERESLSPA